MSALDSDEELTSHFNLEDAENFSYHEEPFNAIQVSEAGQIATKTTPHPQPPYPPYAQIEFYGDNIGSQARLIVGGDLVGGVLDTSNAIAAQVTLGDNCSTLELIDLSDDSPITAPLLMWGIDRNEWHRLTLCYDPDTGNAKATVHSLESGGETYAIFGDYPASPDYSGGPIGAYAAFGTGPTSADNVYFRNFAFYRLWYCGESPYTEDCGSPDDYEPPPRTYCFRCDPFCEYWTSDLSVDSACLWTTDSGTLTGDVLSATDTAITFNQQLPTRAVNAFSASFAVATDWPDNGVVGDSFTASVGNGAVTATVEITAIDPVSKEITCLLTLAGPDAGVLTDSFTWVDGAGVIICVENTVVTAASGSGSTYGQLAAPLASDIISFSISSQTDISLTDLWVNALGRVTLSDGTKLECGFCSRPCAYCSDAFPSGLLVEISGLEAFQSLAFDVEEEAYYCANDLGECPDELEYPERTVMRDFTPMIDCDDFNTAFYLEATVNTSCQACFDMDVDSEAQRGTTVTCPNPNYPWYVASEVPLCRETPYTLYQNVEYVQHFVVCCNIFDYNYPYYRAGKIGGTGNNYSLKSGFSFTAGHYYLRVEAIFAIMDDDWEDGVSWYQLWVKDLGTSPVECLEIDQEELEWVGYYGSPGVGRRYCGGGADIIFGGPYIPVDSTSIAKVTAL